MSDFGVHLHNAIQRGQVDVNFKSIALGDPWIDPLAMVSSYGKWLLTLSQLDVEEVKEVDAMAESMRLALERGDNLLATELWGEQQTRIVRMTGGVSFYDFTKNSLRTQPFFVMNRCGIVSSFLLLFLL